MTRGARNIRLMLLVPLGVVAACNPSTAPRRAPAAHSTATSALVPVPPDADAGVAALQVVTHVDSAVGSFDLPTTLPLQDRFHCWIDRGTLSVDCPNMRADGPPLSRIDADDGGFAIYSGDFGIAPATGPCGTAVGSVHAVLVMLNGRPIWSGSTNNDGVTAALVDLIPETDHGQRPEILIHGVEDPWYARVLDVVDARLVTVFEHADPSRYNRIYDAKALEVVPRSGGTHDLRFVNTLGGAAPVFSERFGARSGAGRVERLGGVSPPATRALGEMVDDECSVLTTPYGRFIDCWRSRDPHMMRCQQRWTTSTGAELVGCHDGLHGGTLLAFTRRRGTEPVGGVYWVADRGGARAGAPRIELRSRSPRGSFEVVVRGEAGEPSSSVSFVCYVAALRHYVGEPPMTPESCGALNAQASIEVEDPSSRWAENLRWRSIHGMAHAGVSRRRGA
jgi:hypothetical protein